MPKKSTPGQLIRDAVNHLRAGGPARPDLADAVEELAQQRFRGWSGVEGTVVSIKADSDLLARVGDGRLSTVAVEGCTRFLNGTLEPARTVRGPAGAKTPTSVRIPDDLLARVEARCRKATTQLGWTVRPVNVFVAAFEQDAAAPRE